MSEEVLENAKISRTAMMITIVILTIVVALIVMLPYYTQAGPEAQEPDGRRETAPRIPRAPIGPGIGGEWHGGIPWRG